MLIYTITFDFIPVTLSPRLKRCRISWHRCIPYRFMGSSGSQHLLGINKAINADASRFL
ncbi:hypothetical protein MJ581_10320 [Escherichia coli]|nr:hypothetical protein MJ581_10320 [Escherichia coli]